MKNLKKSLTNILLVITMFFTLSPAIVSYATVTPIPKAETTTVTTTKPLTDADISGDKQVPNISLDKAKEHIERKSYDIVEILQVFAKPFTAIIFIVCAFISLFGALTRGGFLGKGLLGMLISGIMYTAILYAPEIMNFMSNWLAT